MSELVMPHDVEVERALLGTVLVAPRLLGAVSAVHGVRPEHFYSPKHERVYAAMLALAARGEAIDHLTVAAEVGEAVDRSYIAALPAEAVIAHYESYAERVVNLHALRVKIGAYLEGIAAAKAEDWDGIADAEAKLVTERQRRRHRTRQERQQALMDFLDRDDRDIWATPWPKLNDLLAGGLRRGQLTILGGWAAHGKSALALLLLDYLRRRYALRCALYTNEMEAEELDLRSVAREAEIPYWRLSQGKLRDGEHERFVNAVKRIGSSYELIEAAGMTAQEIAQDIRREQWDVVVLDLLNGLPNSSETRHIDENVKTLAACSRQARCHIIATQHLNQHRHAGHVYPPEPVAADLRGSGQIYDLANIVLFIYRCEDEDAPGEPSDEAVLKVAKARGGSPGRVPLIFDGNRMRFTELEPVRRLAA